MCLKQLNEQCPIKIHHVSSLSNGVSVKSWLVVSDPPWNVCRLPPLGVSLLFKSSICQCGVLSTSLDVGEEKGVCLHFDVLACICICAFRKERYHEGKRGGTLGNKDERRELKFRSDLHKHRGIRV